MQLSRSLLSLSAASLLFFGCKSSSDDAVVEGSGGGTVNGVSAGGSGASDSTGGTSAAGGESNSGAGSSSTAGASSGAGTSGGAPGADSGGQPAVGGESGSGSGSGSDGTGGKLGVPSASGGSEGTGSSDFFGDSRCAAAGLLLCDGFETGEIDAALWQVGKASENTVEVSSEQAARGSMSLHLVANNGYAYVKNESVFPVANNDYFGRMFIMVKRFSTVDWAHWTVAEAAGTGNGSKIRVGGQYIRTDFDTDTWANRWGVGSDGGDTGDWTTPDGDPEGAVLEPAFGDWLCLEWEHKGSTNETRFFLDGVEHTSLATAAAAHGGDSGEYILPQMTSLWFGWQQYQADDEPFNVWIDEVAIDDERIGCTL